MEHGQEMAREHIQSEMRRKKRYHDNRLFWEKFLVGDEVFVFFHRNQPGKSPKFICYWHGTYVVIEKYSGLTYKVKNKGTCFHKVVHVDRMRRRHRREETQALSQNGIEEQ